MRTALLLALALPAAAADQAALREGARHYAAGEYERSLEAYTRASQAAPEDPDALFGAGAALYQLGKHELAEAAFRKAAERTGGADARYNLGNASFRTGRIEEAADAYREALLQDPTAADAKHNLAVALLKKQQKPPPQPQDAPPKESPPKDAPPKGAPPKSPPKPQQGMSEEDARRLLQAVKEREKELGPKALEKQRAQQQPKGKQGEDGVEKDW